MKSYLLESYVNEIEGTENVSYLLKDNDTFFMTGYKVLSNSESRGLIECASLRYNGKIKLVYFTSQYMSLQGIINYLDIAGVRTVLRNLLMNILDIKGNGFLKCENLDAGPEKIFVDRNTLEVYLIYLPIKMVEGALDRTAFENELRTQLIKLFNSAVNLNGPELQSILFQLSNGSVTFEELYRFLQQTDKEGLEMLSRPTGHVETSQTEQQRERPIKLQSQDGRVIFEIQKDEFVLGKSAERVDGVISGNPAVSRIHCKVVRKNGNYYLVDLQSSNGTYINGERLSPNMPAQIMVGDRIRVANLEFVAK